MLNGEADDDEPALIFTLSSICSLVADQMVEGINQVILAELLQLSACLYLVIRQIDGNTIAPSLPLSHHSLNRSTQLNLEKSLAQPELLGPLHHRFFSSTQI